MERGQPLLATRSSPLGSPSSQQVSWGLGHKSAMVETLAGQFSGGTKMTRTKSQPTVDRAGHGLFRCRLTSTVPVCPPGRGRGCRVRENQRRGLVLPLGARKQCGTHTLQAPVGTQAGTHRSSPVPPPAASSPADGSVSHKRSSVTSTARNNLLRS